MLFSNANVVLFRVIAVSQLLCLQAQAVRGGKNPSHPVFSLFDYGDECGPFSTQGTCNQRWGGAYVCCVVCVCVCACVCVCVFTCAQMDACLRY